MDLGIYGKLLFWTLTFSVILYETWQIIKGNASKTWQRHIARVIDVRVKTRTDEGVEESRPHIEYRYQYRGDVYQNSKIMYGNLWSTNYSKAIRSIAGVTKGKDIEIYVNPKNPHQSVLNTGYQGNALWFFGFFAVFIAIALTT